MTVAWEPPTGGAAPQHCLAELNFVCSSQLGLPVMPVLWHKFIIEKSPSGGKNRNYQRATTSTEHEMLTPEKWQRWGSGVGIKTFDKKPRNKKVFLNNFLWTYVPVIIRMQVHDGRRHFRFHLKVEIKKTSWILTFHMTQSSQWPSMVARVSLPSFRRPVHNQISVRNFLQKITESINSLKKT